MKAYSISISKSEPLPPPNNTEPSEPVNQVPLSSQPSQSEPPSQPSTSPVSEPTKPVGPEVPASSSSNSTTKFDTPSPGEVFDQPAKVENPLVQSPNPTDAHYVSKPSPPPCTLYFCLGFGALSHLCLIHILASQDTSNKDLPVIENVDKGKIEATPITETKDCVEMSKTTWLIIKTLSVVRNNSKKV